MSIDYQVIVPPDRWPTFAGLNDALRARDFPVEILPGKSMAMDGPVREVAGTLGMAVRLNTRAVELEVLAQPYSDPLPAYDETNETLEMIGAEIRVRPGDYLFAVGLRSSSDEWIAASYIMATLVLDFGGYGYEMQAESHGRDPWARDLIEAAKEGFPALAALALQSAPPPSSRRAPVGKPTNNKRILNRENLLWLAAFVLAAVIGFALSEFSHAKHQ